MLNTIFVVDDVDTNLTTAREALKEKYRVMTMPSAARMFTMLERVTPALILLDIEMPDMDGFEVLQLLKANPDYAGIPVIFLTGITDFEVEARGFQLGVTDFIRKPFSAPVLLNRIKTHLEIDEIIRERTQQILRLRNAIVFSFADIVEARDANTGGHIERTSKYIELLASKIIEHGEQVDEFSLLNLESFVSSARLHDVGKIAVSDVILNKPGPLSDDEFEIMKLHTVEGVNIIEQIASRADDGRFLRNAKLFAGYHHERWDGKGYPYGLAKTNIPLQGRIMAVADVYDALVTERPYKKAFPEQVAVDIILDGSGSHFDPHIVDIFTEVKEDFGKIRELYST